MLKRGTVGEAAAVSDRSEPTCIFLHIPKTGGVTIRHIVERNYPPDDRHLVPVGSQDPELWTWGRDGDGTSSSGTPALPPQIEQLSNQPDSYKRRLRIVYGHMAFGVHRLLPGAATYVTMLREPTTQVLSHYHYIRRRKRHWMYQAATNLSLEGFARAWVARWDNLQTRMISGELTRPGRCTEATLEHAKRNIEEHFGAVGLTERFDETVVLWGKVLGWRKLAYIRRNVGTGLRTPVPPEAVRLIEELNDLDAELYRFVTQRFEEQLARYPSLQKEVARFRGRNALYQWTHPRRLRPFLRTVKRTVTRRGIVPHSEA
jgi:hypothetical protein